MSGSIACLSHCGKPIAARGPNSLSDCENLANLPEFLTPPQGTRLLIQVLLGYRTRHQVVERVPRLMVDSS